MQWENVKQELSSLQCITRAGNWLFLLLSRLAEPLMFLSVLYVVSETVLPAIFKAPFFTGVSFASVIILNTAPEVIAPGAFIQARLNEDRRYSAMGWAFIGLTFITLASFIWQFPDAVNSIVLFLRCATGVLYSLLVRITPQTGEVPARRYQEEIDRLTAELSGLQESFHRRIVENSSIIENKLTVELSSLRENFESSTIEELKAELSQAREEIRRLAAVHARMVAAPEPALPALPPAAIPAKQRRRDTAPLAAKQAKQEAPERQSDAREFVFACLAEQADLKLIEIEARARAQGYELSLPTLSRYRKQFASLQTVKIENLQP